MSKLNSVFSKVIREYKSGYFFICNFKSAQISTQNPFQMKNHTYVGGMFYIAPKNTFSYIYYYSKITVK